MLGERSSSTNDQEHQKLITALRESEILRELAELLASSLDLKRILQVLTQRTTEVCGIERCSVWLLEDNSEAFRPTAYHLSSQRISSHHIKVADRLWQQGTILFDDSELYQLLKSQGIVVLDDLHVRPKLQKVADTFLVRSVLLIALRREGRIVGMMSLDDPDLQRIFSKEQQQLACAIGQQAALAIDNARLYEQAQNERTRAERLIERAQAINQVALTVNSGEELPVVLEIATRHLVRGLSADAGIIALLEAEQLHVVSHVGKTVEPFETTVALNDLPICYQVASSGSPLFITADQPVESEIHWFRQFGFDNIMIVPLMSGVGHQTTSPSSVPHCIGFAFVHFQNPHYRPRKGHFAFAQDIAAQCALAIEKAYLMADLHRTAALATERANTMDAVFQAMTEGITVLDMSGEVLVRNNAASYFLGVPVNSTDQLYSFLERYPTYSVHGQPIAKEDFPLVRALKGERIRGERFMTVRSDGVQRVLEISVTQMFDHTNQQIGLVSAFRDITEQTRVEGRIRKALETMLHVAEEVSGITDIKDILRNVLERTLATLNCERGAVQLYDEELQEFTPLLSTGFTEVEEKAWLQEQHLWLQPTENQYQGFRNQILDGHATVINAEQHPRLPELPNHTMILAAPITHHNHLLGLMILDRSALLKNTLAPREFSIWDMAVIEGIAQLAGLAIEQAHLQQETMAARSSEALMREANALKDEFLAITAHEFRTPLTVILAHSQMAQRVLRKTTDQDTSQRLNDSLSIIEEQAHQLTNIVNTFLEVAQINRGQLVLKLAPVDLTDIIKQVVTNQSATAPDHTITYEIAPDVRPYMVMGDSARLSQVLGNLIQNAIKYSPFGGPITISLRQYAGEPGRTIEAQVADKGIGIPKEAQARLFERFYRAPNIDGSKTKGVGLGLYIVAALLKMHGGNIRAESSGVYGEGSRFIITLPTLESETVERE
jgi:PAS domain S-box-containing protein